ncbi:hypothetical protein [Paludibaculum fermentans]|uniref:hypothetical protein n=1 Tax=Paludibaculum fermentans TaxID=1473598 RepID=UPI003EBDC18A
MKIIATPRPSTTAAVLAIAAALCFSWPALTQEPKAPAAKPPKTSPSDQSMQDRLLTLQLSVRELESRVAELQSSARTSDSSGRNYQSVISSLQSTVANQQSSLQSLQMSVQSLQNAVASLQSRVHAATPGPVLQEAAPE